MARKAPKAVDTTRRLAEVDKATGSTGKIWKGVVYTRGDEAKLPKDFPPDGPHWEDYEPDEVEEGEDENEEPSEHPSRNAQGAAGERPDPNALEAQTGLKRGARTGEAKSTPKSKTSKGK